VSEENAENWSKRFTHLGREFKAHFRKRAFREGLEVSLEVEGQTLRIAELGLGEKAIIEKLKAQIDKILK